MLNKRIGILVAVFLVILLIAACMISGPVLMNMIQTIHPIPQH